MTQEVHIDDAQPPSVEEHFKLLVEDRSTISPEYVEITPKDLPHWFDKRLFKIGQEYFLNNMLAFAVAHMTGAISILCVPEMIDVLQYTKRSETVFRSFKRYAETFLLLLELFRSDILKPDSMWFKTLNAIRSSHAEISKRRMKEGLNAIYQKDMVISQFAFAGFVLLCPDRIGLAHSTKEEQRGYIHFWRVTGHLLDISDRMNLARKSVAETTELCRRISVDILAKHMKNPSPEFVKLARNAIDGLWYVDFNLNTDAFFELTYSLSGSKYQKPLGWYATFNYKQREWMLYLCSAPYIGIVFRTTFNYFLLGLYWLVNNYPITAWLKFGKKQSKLCVYSKLK